jgi:polyisoprenoid-binding protein YceI
MNLQSARIAPAVTALALFTITACSRTEPSVAYAKERSGAPNLSVAHLQSSSTAADPSLRFVLASEASAARYRVREQLMGHDFPNDAVGETKSITGGITFDNTGKVVRDASKFTIDASTFVSDQRRRDGYLRGRLLEADNYPTITFVPSEVRGIKLPLPKSGAAPFEVTGDLTVHGVTRPTNWKGTVQFNNAAVTGSASTSFTFKDIQMEPPHVPVLLSVADTIKLEIDFDLVQQK